MSGEHGLAWVDVCGCGGEVVWTGLERLSIDGSRLFSSPTTFFAFSLLFLRPLSSPLLSSLFSSLSTPRSAKHTHREVSGRTLARQHMIGVHFTSFRLAGLACRDVSTFPFSKNHKTRDASQKKFKTKNHPKASRTVNVLSVITHSFLFCLSYSALFARWSSRSTSWYC